MKAAWIKPEVRLPDDDITVLIRLVHSADPVWIGYHDGEQWFYATGNPVAGRVRVTGWMHLPDPEDAP